MKILEIARAQFALTEGLLISAAINIPVGSVGAASLSVAPQQMPRLGTVDERFQSFNVEMLEVTGGDFWKPYGQQPSAVPEKPASESDVNTSVPAGMDPGVYQ